MLASIRQYEERVRVAKEEIIQNNTEENRAKLHGINVEYIKFMKLEESILNYKTQLHWFREGGANSKYSPTLMRGRGRRLFIHKVCTDNDNWVQGDEHIIVAAYQ